MLNWFNREELVHEQWNYKKDQKTTVSFENKRRKKLQTNRGKNDHFLHLKDHFSDENNENQENDKTSKTTISYKKIFLFSPLSSTRAHVEEFCFHLLEIVVFNHFP